MFVLVIKLQVERPRFRVEFEGTADLAGEYGPKDASQRQSLLTLKFLTLTVSGLVIALKMSALPKLGRQRVIYNNSRHIGNVGWRLNEQTLMVFVQMLNSWKAKAVPLSVATGHV